MPSKKDKSSASAIGLKIVSIDTLMQKNSIIFIQQLRQNLLRNCQNVLINLENNLWKNFIV